MWLMLALAVVVCVAVLYVPGYLFARSLSVARFASVAIAPMISIFFLAVLGIVLFEVGVTCSGPVLLAIAVAIGAIALLVSKGIAQAKAPNASRELIAIDDVKGAWKAAALYVAVAFAVVFVVFLLAIDGPESFSRNDDTTVHLAIVRGFLDTGTFSTLHASSYLDQGVTSSFYPSAWHVVTAVVASFFGNAVTLAANASIIALTAVVFPLGMCLLFLKLFGEGKRVVWAGSLFVVAFAVYPFAAELFRQSNIPKRLIPATVALGAFSFTMDALPGTPQIQNIIPTSFFGTNAWAAPWLGLIGSLFIIIFGLLWLERQRRKAQARGEGYGTDLQNEPETPDDIDLPHPLIAIAPLLLVGVLNLLFTHWIPQWYGASHELTLPGLAKPVVTEVGKITAIWAVQAALLSGIVLVLVCGYRNIRGRLAEGSRTAVGGAILAAMNTASEYGFGAVIAALPGFLVLSKALAAIPNPLLNEAISVTVLAGITGSASGGMSIALAAMSETFVAAAHAANIPLEVLHRVAAMASGGMDTLPHNGAVITLLAITGLSHRQAYGGIFAITVIKSLAVLFVIATFYVTGIV